jgi:hypothetical protein
VLPPSSNARSSKLEYGNGHAEPRMGKREQGPDMSMANKGKLLLEKERSAPVIVRKVRRYTCSSKKSQKVHLSQQGKQECSPFVARKVKLCIYTNKISKNVYLFW